MATTESTASSAIRDLVIIINDRYEGYKRAAEETDDVMLRDLFLKLCDQSLGFKSELEAHLLSVEHTDHVDTDDTTTAGKLYRVWMDVKSALSGADRKTILSSCEHGEDVALKGYDEVLNDKFEVLPSDLMMTIRRQRDEVRDAHDMIKNLRDTTD